MNKNDRIIFYTDGVPELAGEGGEMWGERSFLKTLMKSVNDNRNLDLSMQDLSEGIAGHRKDEPLEDDVTFFMVECKKSA